MGLKPYQVLTLAALFIYAAYSALAQTAPAATQSKNLFAVGVGISGFNSDLGQGHILGGTLWGDYTPPHMLRILDGFGLEIEARDLSFGRSPGAWTNERLEVASGGLTYTSPSYRNFSLYGKYLMGFGNIDCGTPPNTWHDTRTVTSMGGGVNYHVYKNVWARADYEFQKWPDFWQHSGSNYGAALTPEGFTVGALYHFNHTNRH
ncbi:MAG: outer membrane beta-barrel protein [Terracidiphilus sp.]|jgi:opacity protein-like surface antigen